MEPIEIKEPTIKAPNVNKRMKPTLLKHQL